MIPKIIYTIEITMPPYSLLSLSFNLFKDFYLFYFILADYIFFSEKPSISIYLLKF